MFRRMFLTLQVLTPIALCAALVASPAGAQPRPKGNTAKAAAEIKKSGKISGGANYWRQVEARFPNQKKSVMARSFVKPKGGAAALAPAGRSSLTVVGDAPPGFGKGFSWDRADDEVLLVMFINAADPLGVSIDGLKAGDQVQIMSASGIASFTDDKGNPLASSIIGLVAAGGKVAAGAAGAPEAAPIIDAAETFAKDLYKALAVKHKRRDAFGVDPGSGHKARQEGGILVCLPEAGGTFYSGDPRSRWIQGSGVRTDDKLPSHIYGSFFPRQGETVHNTRTVRQDGQMYVVPWDWAFDDNAGFYKVFVKLKKGNGPPPVVIERKNLRIQPKIKR